MPVTVVIGTDGSDEAVAAAQQALEVLAADAEVHLVCVADEPAVATAGAVSGFAGGIPTPETVDAAWDGAIEEATAALERTRSTLGATDVRIHVGRGAPGPVLCEYAREFGAAVIAVGSRGRGAIRRALLGSVSTHVVHNAPCPVLVVRAGTTDEHD